MQSLAKSPLVIGAAGMLCAAGGFVLSYNGMSPVFGYTGGALGLVLGTLGIVLAVRTGRSMRLPVNACVMSALFIAGGVAMGQFGLQASGRDKASPQQEAQLLRGKISSCKARIGRLERQLQEHEALQAAARLKPEMAALITIHRYTPRYEDEDFRLHNGELTTHRYLVLDVEVENQTGRDFDSIALDVQYVTSEQPGSINMPVIDTKTHVPSGEVTLVSARIKQYSLPVTGAANPLPDLDAIRWDIRFFEATIKDDTGTYRGVTRIGLPRSHELSMTHMEHTLDKHRSELAELEAELANIQ